MAIDFHVRANRFTYAGRQADVGWIEAMRCIVDPMGKSVADIGCGGGIYSRAWHEMGAAAVVGIDFSREMVGAAREQAADLSRVFFRQGDAAATGLPSASADIVFQRALIHHLKSYEPCFVEALRVLIPGGTLIVQDRTPVDVDLAGSPEHIRGYFFERFPRLRAIEAARRPTGAVVRAALVASGFRRLSSAVLWEVRKSHADRAHLTQDLRARIGRSILHELDGDELEELIAYITARLAPDLPVVERDRWTLWSAVA